MSSVLSIISHIDPVIVADFHISTQLKPKQCLSTFTNARSHSFVEQWEIKSSKLEDSVKLLILCSSKQGPLSGAQRWDVVHDKRPATVATPDNKKRNQSLTGRKVNTKRFGWKLCHKMACMFDIPPVLPYSTLAISWGRYYLKFLSHGKN